MTPAKPSLALLRSLTDEHVLRTLMLHKQLTRAGLAMETGLSKPTISDSVRRLSEAGLLRDTGHRTTGRGRVGTYYALADDLGVALVVAIAPEGISAETVDVSGTVLSRGVESVSRPTHPLEVTSLLERVASRTTALARAKGASRVRVAVVSAADPVDRHTGRLVHLPDAPFLIGELSPADTLATHVDGPVIVDNDVHWAARAEANAAGPDHLEDFAYLHLGAGLGLAVVTGGQILRGHRGIAGEVAHLLTRGPGGQAMTLMEFFAELGLQRAGSTAIDTERLLSRFHAGDAAAAQLRSVLAEGICGVLSALVAVAEPSVILLGGEWGRDPGVVASIANRFQHAPRSVPVRPASVSPEPWLDGARQDALTRLRSEILAQAASLDQLAAASAGP